MNSPFSSLLVRADRSYFSSSVRSHGCLKRLLGSSMVSPYETFRRTRPSTETSTTILKLPQESAFRASVPSPLKMLTNTRRLAIVSTMAEVSILCSPSTIFQEDRSITTRLISSNKVTPLPTVGLLVLLMRDLALMFLLQSRPSMSCAILLRFSPTSPSPTLRRSQILPPSTTFPHWQTAPPSPTQLLLSTARMRP